MIILSYQGPSFTDFRAVKLVGGIDPNEYIAGLPEASCAFKYESADDVKLKWEIVRKAYDALAPRGDKGNKFATEIDAQDELYALLTRVAKVVDKLPKSEAGKAAKDDEKTPPKAAAGTEAADVPAPKPKKEKPPKIEDKWSKMDVNALAAAAKKQGYKEEPAPNGGVRVMRLRNWLRKNGK